MKIIAGLIILFINFAWSTDTTDTLKDTIIEQAETGGTILQQFEQFMVDYGKNYTSLAERMMRFGIFKESLKRIEKLMANRKGNVVFGVTEFADLTDEEFMGSDTGFAIPGNVTEEAIRSEHRRSPVESPSGSKREGSTSPGGSDSPPSPAKREKSFGTSGLRPSGTGEKKPPGPAEGVWPPPTDSAGRDFFFGDPMKYPVAANMRLGKLKCGACWAFSAATAVEILYGQETGKLQMLSKQQLIDCDKENGGCRGGGSLRQALEYIRDTGLASEKAYPYVAKDGVCKTKVEPIVRLKYMTRLQDAEDVQFALRTSPIPVTFHHPPDFKFYKSGVYDPDCSDDVKQFNHGAVIVGYNRESWIIQNNHGPRWGMQGYMYLKKGKCGVGKYAFWLYVGTQVQWDLILPVLSTAKHQSSTPSGSGTLQSN